jgi:hypothetical protein
MKKRVLLLSCGLILAAHLLAQQFVSATYLGAKTKAELLAQFGVIFIEYDVKYYRILYTTPDLQGQQDTVSGLLVVPQMQDYIFPRLVYQHGTAGSRFGVPSYNVDSGGEGVIGWLFGGLGFISFLPDYLGLGYSEGVHPYVHARTEASTALDMLRATPFFLYDNGYYYNQQLFITGYSQGGHAGMALHQKLQLEEPDTWPVTAAAHLSGPYSIGDVMRQLILSNEEYYYPAYLPNTAVSYQAAYGNLYTNLNEVFRPPYATLVQQFQDGQLDLSDLNEQLIAALIANEGASIASKMLQPDLVQAVTNDPDHPINVALRDNDVYHFTPSAPTRLFYCMNDDQVPFENSIVARDSFIARGTPNFAAQDVNPAADHGGCVVPALTQTVLFFLGYRDIAVVVDAPVPGNAPDEWQVQPNPADEQVHIQAGLLGGRVGLWALDGRLLYSAELAPGEIKTVAAGNFPAGPCVVRWDTGAQVQQKRLMIRH